MSAIDPFAPITGRIAAVEEVVTSALPLGARVDLLGAPGGAAGYLLARIALGSRRPVVAVTRDEKSSVSLAADLRHFSEELGGEKGPLVLRYPNHDLPAYSSLRPDRRNVLSRLAVLALLRSTRRTVALVVPAVALRRLVVPRAAFDERSLALEVGQEVDRDDLVRGLDEAGYRQTPLVEDRGTLAVRGGLVDVFPPAAFHPWRIELDGDLIWRIRSFDPETQLTTGETDKVRLEPADEVIRGEVEIACALDRIRGACDEVDLPTVRTQEILEAIERGSSMVSHEAWLPAFHDELDPLWRYVPEGALWFLEGPSEVLEAWERQGTLADSARSAALEENEPSLPPHAFLASVKQARREIDEASRIFSFELAIQGADEWDAKEPLDLNAQGNEPLVRELRGRTAKGSSGDVLSPLKGRLRTLTEEQGAAVRLVARSIGQAERLVSMVRRTELDANLVPEGMAVQHGAHPGEIQVVVGDLTRGFYLPGEGRAWIAEDEILGQRPQRRRRKQGTAKEAFEDLSALEIGQMVVHGEHGVGRYCGLVHREVNDVEFELIHLEYLGGDRLYLPVYRLNQIHRYVGGEGIKLDRLGGQTFAKRKKKARRHVEDLADKLLQVQATRAAVPGRSCGPHDPLFVELEATFPYDETAEQQRAIDEVVADLESEKVMDRLVCGDVGFGKTEVAVRAAFRVVLGGRQVAVLVPTTVLATQHYTTFRDRLARLPVNVEVISRFRSAAEQRKVASGLKTGTVDIVVGTHRLLSKDIYFKSLGLLVIDEEHRFGVEHKERLKRLRSQVDVLTLSATPIPRTLQMALSDLRDLSLITTAPEGRRPIRTYVCQMEDKVIRESIQRELARGGQVFYVRNRIKGLRERTEHLQALVPQARFAMGHGQMSEGRLEEIMLEFVEGRLDVLVCTTIIESGLDVPRANTVIIERADHLGLAQLYHVRGRVGRAQERAYAYLLVPPAGAMTSEGRQRIAALQRLTELGSGFALATMDLEIRGAGELLGVEQSGQVAAVGYQMYIELLEEAISELQGLPPKSDFDPELNFDVTGFIPEEHVPDTGQRLALYQRLAGAEDSFEVEEIAAEMRDRFGPSPPPLENLFRMMEVKALARRLGALGVEASRKSVTVHLSDRTPLDPQKVLGLVTAAGSSYRVTPDMRLRCRIKEGMYPDSIEAAQAVAQELAGLLG